MILSCETANSRSPLPTNLRSVPGEGQGEGNKGEWRPPEFPVPCLPVHDSNESYPIGSSSFSKLGGARFVCGLFFASPARRIFNSASAAALRTDGSGSTNSCAERPRGGMGRRPQLAQGRSGSGADARLFVTQQFVRVRGRHRSRPVPFVLAPGPRPPGPCSSCRPGAAPAPPCRQVRPRPGPTRR